MYWIYLKTFERYVFIMYLLSIHNIKIDILKIKIVITYYL